MTTCSEALLDSKVQIFGDWKRRSICKRNIKLALYLQTSAEMTAYHGNGFAYIELTERAPLER